MSPTNYVLDRATHPQIGKSITVAGICAGLTMQAVAWLNTCTHLQRALGSASIGWVHSRVGHAGCCYRYRSNLLSTCNALFLLALSLEWYYHWTGTITGQPP